MAGLHAADLKAEDPSLSSSSIVVGSVVEAKDPTDATFRTGTVQSIDVGKEVCSILFQDGSINQNVPLASVRIPQKSATKDGNNAINAPTFAIGDKIEARYGGGETYYPGTIGFVHIENSTCDIMYDDGDGESGVAFDLIRKKESIKKPEPTPESSGKATFAVGSQVEIRNFKGGWKRGTITVVRDEGSFDVAIEDGTTEKGVPPSLVRVPNASEAKPQTTKSGSSNSSSKTKQSQGIEAAVAAALKLPVTTKQERHLREELEISAKALERQMKLIEKNKKTVASLKTKIANFQAALGGQ